jgi:hypothetical protein
MPARVAAKGRGFARNGAIGPAFHIAAYALNVAAAIAACATALCGEATAIALEMPC